MKLPSPPAIFAAVGLAVLILAGVIGVIVVFQQGEHPNEPDIKTLVTEAVLMDLPELQPTNVRVMWRRTANPNEIFVAGMLTAFSKNAFYFTTMLMKYNTGWVVGHVLRDERSTYQVLTSRDKKKQLTKK